MKKLISDNAFTLTMASWALAILVITVSISGCSEDADNPNPTRLKQLQTDAEAIAKDPVQVIVSNPKPRIEVTRLGIVDDYLAYNQARGTYLIHDNVTGLDYIGVSGIGIVKVGSNGKTQSER